MLDTRCPACLASRPFYRAVSGATAETPGTGFVVLVDESVDEARSWLAIDGIVVDRIIRLRSRAQAGFLGTPTLMLVNQDGVITDIANQALSSADERRFIQRVRRPAVGPPLRVGYFMRELEVSAELSLVSDANAQLVDTRDRAEFQREHSAWAINIPRDELLARSPAELLRAFPVYVDCRYDDQQLCRIAGVALQEAKFADIRVLLQ
jgi:rhodanese-related sulfurtransferase